MKCNGSFFLNHYSIDKMRICLALPFALLLSSVGAATVDFTVFYLNDRDPSTHCKWQGKRLPSEVEWTRGCNDMISLPSPWGEYAIDREKANYDPAAR